MYKPKRKRSALKVRISAKDAQDHSEDAAPITLDKEKKTSASKNNQEPQSSILDKQKKSAKTVQETPKPNTNGTKPEPPVQGSLKDPSNAWASRAEDSRVWEAFGWTTWYGQFRISFRSLRSPNLAFLSEQFMRPVGSYRMNHDTGASPLMNPNFSLNGISDQHLSTSLRKSSFDNFFNLLSREADPSSHNNALKLISPQLKSSGNRIDGIGSYLNLGRKRRS